MRSLLRELEIKAGSWALVDQATVSLGNFLTQMLLARQLSSSDYGVFALIFGVIFVIVNTIGIAITYPLSVKGASATPTDLGRLTSASLWMVSVVLLPEGVIILIAASVLHHIELFSSAFLAMALWQLQETLRRSIMARLAYREALAGDALSYLGQALIIFLLKRAELLSLNEIFITIAATSAAAAVAQWYKANPRFIRSSEVRSILSEYVRIGGFVSASSIVNGITQQLFPWILNFVSGTASAASLQAIINPLKVFNPVLVGAQNLMIPAAAKVKQRRGHGPASRHGVAYTAIGSLILFPYIVAIFIWPKVILGMLYGSHSQYAALVFPMRMCVFAYALGYWGDALCSLLNGLGLPNRALIVQLVALSAAALVGVPMTLVGGLIGAIAGLGVFAAAKVSLGMRELRDHSLPTELATVTTESPRIQVGMDAQNR